VSGDRPVRKCPHGVDVGPLDDYGVPDEVRESPYSAYCWKCNGEDGPTPQYPEPALARLDSGAAEEDA
jgi:hypothetical protein